MERHLALIGLLADGRCHSGEAIAAHLGVTRAAVWKALHKAAEQFDVEIESVRGQGYRLIRPLELLDPETLREALPSLERLIRLEIHPSIDSTNAYLMREAAAGAPSGAVCLAERQTAGRGRRGRRWVSPFGVNLYLSLLWRYALPPAALGGVSLAVGATVAEVLARAGVADLVLKWPNDILWQGRKLAGILLEVAGESHGPSYLVVGIGINLGMRDAQGQDIDQPWVALDEALGGGRAPGRNVLAAQLIAGLFDALETYGESSLTPFLERWSQFDALRGSRIALLLGERQIEGVYAGIDADGGLLLDTEIGRQRYHSGEVSLRLA